MKDHPDKSRKHGREVIYGKRLSYTEIRTEKLIIKKKVFKEGWSLMIVNFHHRFHCVIVIINITISTTSFWCSFVRAR